MIYQTKCLRFLAVCCLLALASGCKTLDVNPGTARSGRGYVDLFTEPKTGVWWKVDVFDSRGKAFRQYAAQLQAPAENILRLEAKPGRYKARVSFVNAAVESPAEVEVVVVDGMITPVRVTGVPAESSYVRTREDRLRWYSSRMTDQNQQVWKIAATALPPIPYAPKERMAYWQ